VPCHVCSICNDGGAPAFCLDHRYYGFQPEAGGGMAEFHVSPEERLHKIPANLSDDEAALVEPVSVAYHAIWGRGGGVAPHDRVGVFGVGPIGLFCLQIAKASGAHVTAVEPEKYRRDLATQMGADEVVDPRELDADSVIMDVTAGLGFSLILECSGSVPGIASTVDAVAVDGRIVLTGQSMGLKIPIELGKTIWKHARVIGSCGSPYFFPKTLVFMSRHLVDLTRIITHHFPLSQVQEAFELGLTGTHCGKILLEI
jgi:L-iditol 2-dehydrogenase